MPFVWDKMENNTRARLHHRGSKHDPRSDLRSTQKTVAPFEFRAGLEIEVKFISNHRNWRFEISIRDQQPSSKNIKLDPDSELGSFDLGSGKILVQPGIRLHVAPHLSVVMQLGMECNKHRKRLGVILVHGSCTTSHNALRSMVCSSLSTASQMYSIRLRSGDLGWPSKQPERIHTTSRDLVQCALDAEMGTHDLLAGSCAFSDEGQLCVYHRAHFIPHKQSPYEDIITPDLNCTLLA
ncbi:hypothetical protein PR048_032434 [Dryococelus australis]|uniref:Uncharacterized protein n=1 Tax=Dryococelus australis TaxID=614101 RepID=A0ABQ9G269_9NEOP|nr:hypothetical protein PR048_032434 [Dryococelus australis]